MPIALDTEAISQYDFLKDLPWLSHGMWGNTVYSYILTCVSFIVIWAALFLLRAYADRALRQRVDDGHATGLVAFLSSLTGTIKPLVLALVALFLASKRLHVADTLERGIKFIVLAAVTIQISRLLGEVAQFMILRTKTLGRSDAMAQNTGKNLVVLARFGIWTAGVMFLLDNAGFNVSTFIAGLGIGGVAIALATQAILGDTFNSFAIALDKPFEVGDFVVIDALQGVVEHIGLKSTRVRASSGELLVFSNSDLVKSRIRNFKRMEQRRVSFTIRVAYDTPTAKLRKLPELVKASVDGVAETRFERSYLQSFGDVAYVFDSSYFVTKPDYAVYAAVQQAINMNLQAALVREGIQIALPSGAPTTLS